MKCEWKKVALGDIVTFSSGGTPHKGTPEYWNGDIPWISAKTMKDEYIKTSDLFITKEGLLAGSKLAPRGSFLLLTRGSGLFNGIPICYVEEPVAFNQDVKCLQSKDSSISNKYVFYWLKSQTDYLKAKLDVTGIGAGKFNMDFLLNLQVPIPSQTEQAQIVSLADSLTGKIAVNQRINDNLAA